MEERGFNKPQDLLEENKWWDWGSGTVFMSRKQKELEVFIYNPLFIFMISDVAIARESNVEIRLGCYGYVSLLYICSVICTIPL